MNQAMYQKMPRHIAIIMDGNGRWAQQRNLPRSAGHEAGVESARKIIKSAIKQEIEVLTLFVFSRENWRRPKQEVDIILGLFLFALQNEIDELHENNVRLRVIGDKSSFHEELQQQINHVQELTNNNTGLNLVIAADYGGQWDITQATRKIANKILVGDLNPSDITPELFESHLEIADLPNPDLFIRTSGEQRISNFYLWQLAYSELYYSTCHWPEFQEEEFAKAISFFASRQRRFGFTGEQVFDKVKNGEF